MKKFAAYIYGFVAVVILVVAGLFMVRGAATKQNLTVQPHGQKREPITEATCKKANGDLWNFAEGQLTIHNHVVPVAIASTTIERQRGLGLCAAIPEGTGMYFDLGGATIPIFWMKDTLIPIDIVWIYQGQVTGIKANTQPEPGVADTDLTRYRAPGNTDAVLELPAGKAAALGITKGVTIKLIR